MTSTAPVASPTQLPRLTLTLRARATHTPSPSSTPQLTATETSDAAPSAQVYIVRPGDTLLGIALDMRVSVDQIKSANPNIDPLALQVGQQIVVPPPGVAVAAAPTPLPLRVEPPICYELITGSLMCLGQVVNTTDQPVSDVRIRVRVAGAERTTGIEQAIIPPGERAPYSAIFDSGEAALADAALLMAAPEMDPAWATLRIEDLQAEQTGSRCRVQATLHNDSGGVTGPPRLLLTLYDADDAVAGYRVMTGPANLEPGAAQPVEIEAISAVSDGPLTCHLYAEAHRL